jgi:hypothetical protein
VTSSRRAALASLVVGFVVVAFAEVAGPRAARPLYDGVVPTEPYRWLQPPPGQPGGAKGTSATVTVSGGQSGLIVVATDEIPPQAQLFAAPGAITLTPNASTIHVAIEPVAPPAAPPSGYIDGNVYRISVTDQAGAALTAPAAQKVTVNLRSAQPNLASGTIERFDGTSWQPLGTPPTGAGEFLAVVTEFGDFAVVAQGTSPYPTIATRPSPSASIQGSPGPSVTTTEPSLAISGPVATASGGSTTGSGGSGGIPAWIFGIAAVVAVLALAWSALSRPKPRGRPRGWGP